MGAHGIVRRTLPYRNERIITVIRDLYFTGSTSYATKFGHLFPTYQGDDGEVSREVPIPMVSLVATAVSHVTLHLPRLLNLLAVRHSLRVAYW